MYEEWGRLDHLPVFARVCVSYRFLGCFLRHGSLAVLGLMTTRCPHSVIPEVYVETLNLYLGSKAQQYRLQNPSSSSSTSNQADLGSSRQSIGFSSSEHDTLGKKLAAQQKWARSLSRQIDAHKASSDGFTADDRRGCHYPVRPPRDGRRLKRQGPYLVQPEPRELPLSEEAGWGIEGVASDIVVLGDKSSTGPGAGPRTGMNVVGVAWVDGRVDLCVEAQKVEAEWEVDDVSLGRDHDEVLVLTVILWLLTLPEPRLGGGPVVDTGDVRLDRPAALGAARIGLGVVHSAHLQPDHFHYRPNGLIVLVRTSRIGRPLDQLQTMEDIVIAHCSAARRRRRGKRAGRVV